MDSVRTEQVTAGGKEERRCQTRLSEGDYEHSASHSSPSRSSSHCLPFLFICSSYNQPLFPAPLSVVSSCFLPSLPSLFSSFSVITVMFPSFPFNFLYCFSVCHPSLSSPFLLLFFPVFLHFLLLVFFSSHFSFLLLLLFRLFYSLAINPPLPILLFCSSLPFLPFLFPFRLYPPASSLLLSSSLPSSESIMAVVS